MDSRCHYIDFIAHLADSLAFPMAYWDMFGMEDGFGFVSGGNPEPSQIIPCFAAALELESIALSIPLTFMHLQCQDRWVELQTEWEEFGRLYVQYSADARSWHNLAEVFTIRERDFKIGFSFEAPYVRLAFENDIGERYFSSIYYLPCEEANLKVYPNPARKEINLVSPQLRGELWTIQILDGWGRSIWTAKQYASEQMQLDLPELMPGSYLVLLRSDRHAGMQAIISIE